MPNNNLGKLNRYFEKYLDEMIIEDIKLLMERNNELKFSYPYILLVCSCIDLFGGIEKNFFRLDSRSRKRGNSEERFTWFVTEWMSKVNPLYGEESLAYLIYESWRCGVMHQATIKKGFGTSSHLYPRDKHLHYIEDEDMIFVHSLQFADDFLEAQKLYREFINSNSGDTGYINTRYGHLSNMIQENKSKKEQEFNKFVSILKSKNFIFDLLADKSPETTDSTKTKVSSDPQEQKQTTTCLEDNDSESVAPSAPPEEDNL